MADVRTLPKLKSQEHSLEPLWGSDSGRNSNSGKWSGTFAGYFSQVVLEFGKTTQSELDNIQAQLEHPIISLTYKSKNGGNFVTEQFYGTKISGKKEGDWSKKYLPFSVTLTGVEKYQ